MNAQRLLRVAEILDKLPPEKPLDMSRWVDRCGTASCAIGHACLDPYLREQGLELVAGAFPGFGSSVEFSAVSKFFRIPSDEAYRLFNPDEYDQDKVSPAVVASRIREFVAASSATV